LTVEPRGCHVGFHAAVGLAAASIAFLSGLAAAPWSPWLHMALAGLAGGYTFPMLIYLNLATGMASGEPRRGVEGLLACSSIYASFAPPLLALASPGAAAVGVAASGGLSAVYTLMQLGKPRMRWRPFAPLLPAPPAGGFLAGIAALQAGAGVEGVAGLAAAGFTLPMIILVSPATVGSVYGRRSRRAQPLSLPAALTPVLALGLGWEAALKASLALGAVYLALLLPGAPAAARRGGARRYIAFTHASALAGSLPGLAAGGLPLIHFAYLGFAAPHALMHVLVRGGEVPFTVRPRFWPLPSPLLLAAASLARPVEPLASWILALSAFTLAALALASGSPVPPAFRREQDIRFND